MWSKALALCALLAGPAAAEYTHAPFHDRPLEVAALALAVLEGQAVKMPKADVPLAAAVASFLLISGHGLAEAYEGAVDGGEDDAAEEGEENAEEGDGYETAYSLLQTIKPWLAAVRRDDDTQDLVARLDALMPTRERPERLDSDPEAAEVVAQALVGQLERAADADLYLGRDLRRAMDTVAGIAAQGCAGTAGDRGRTLRIAAIYVEDSLAAPLSILAADRLEAIEVALDALVGGKGDTANGCADLATAFTDARKVLFP